MKLYSGIIELQKGWFVRLPYPMTWIEMSRYRFDPVTLLMVGTGVMAAGQIQQGRVAASEAQSAANLANYNAAVQEREAEAIRKKTRFDQIRHAEESARIQGALRTKLAGAGAVGSGLLEEEQFAELELERFLLGYEGEIEAERALSQAELDRMSGKLALQRGKAARQASYIGAGATLLTGFGTAGMYGKTPGVTKAGLTTSQRYMPRTSSGLLTFKR